VCGGRSAQRAAGAVSRVGRRRGASRVQRGCVSPSLARAASARARATAATTAAPSPLRADAVTVVPVPGMGDSISEGTVVKWEKAVGDWVRARSRERSRARAPPPPSATRRGAALSRRMRR
jgi:hypothetical protein